MATRGKTEGEASAPAVEETPVSVGEPAPDFTLPGTTGTISLADLLGHVSVLFFYPRDMSPGCTTEACDFRDAMAELTARNVKVVGISPDSLSSHAKFTAKHQLPFPLLSDPEGEVARRYGCWKEKNLYGKRSYGVERSTFVIDQQGIVRAIWRKVRVPGHVRTVAEFVGRL